MEESIEIKPEPGFDHDINEETRPAQIKQEIIDENVSSPDEEDCKMFSRESIALMASSLSIENLNDNVCQHIAEELFYKTKELIYVSKLILTQSKRSKLTTNDVKKAMKLLGGIELYGHSSGEEVKFLHIPSAAVYVEESQDIEIDEEQIAECSFNVKKEPYVTGRWIMPETYPEYPALNKSISYFETIAKTILKGSPAHLKVALSDLRTNSKIGPVCPLFLNLVARTVKNPRDLHLTNALVATVHAIAHNKFVDPSPYFAANEAVNALLSIVTENNVAKVGDDYVDNDDDLTVRMRAGILLAKVIMMWNIELKEQLKVVMVLLKDLVNPSAPLQLHYGAIVALTSLGHRRLDCFWPIVAKFLALLEEKIKYKKNDILVRHVMTAILVAARNTYKKEQGSNPDQLKRLEEVDRMLYSSFGDSVTPFRLVISPPVFRCHKSQVQQSYLKLKISWSQPNPFVYVRRNTFCKPLHEKSASGDLLLIL